MELHYTVNGQPFAVPLSGASLTIGRKASCDIVIEHPSISGVHARMNLKGQGLEIVDLGSSNGLTVGGHKVPAAALKCGDRFRLGIVDFVVTGKGGKSDSVELARMFLTTTLHGEEKRFPLAKAASIAGRQDDCDIPLADPSVSSRHTKLTLRPDGIEVQDLESSNGTFVNGERVTTAVVRHGDRLRIGKIELRVYAGSGRTSTRSQSSSVKGLTPRSTVPLFLLLPEGGGAHVALSAGPLTIGRKAPAQIILDDPSVSSQHLRVEVSPSGIRFTDLDSANGTFLNGERVFRGVIQPGDSVRIGRLLFSVTAFGQEAAAMAVSPEERKKQLQLATAIAAIVLLVGLAAYFLSRPASPSGEDGGDELVFEREMTTQRLVDPSAAPSEREKRLAREEAALEKLTSLKQATDRIPVPAAPQPKPRTHAPAPTPAAPKTQSPAVTPPAPKPAPAAPAPKPQPAEKPAETPVAKPVPAPAPKPTEKPVAPKPAANPAAPLLKDAAVKLDKAKQDLAKFAGEMSPVAAAELAQSATAALTGAKETLEKAAAANPSDPEVKAKLAETEKQLFWIKRLSQP